MYISYGCPQRKNQFKYIYANQKGDLFLAGIQCQLVLLPTVLADLKQLLNVKIFACTLSTDYDQCLFAVIMILCAQKCYLILHIKSRTLCTKMSTVVNASDFQWDQYFFSSRLPWGKKFFQSFSTLNFFFLLLLAPVAGNSYDLSTNDDTLD